MKITKVNALGLRMRVSSPLLFEEEKNARTRKLRWENWVADDCRALNPDMVRLIRSAWPKLS